MAGPSMGKEEKAGQCDQTLWKRQGTKGGMMGEGALWVTYSLFGTPELCPCDGKAAIDDLHMNRCRYIQLNSLYKKRWEVQGGLIWPMGSSMSAFDLRSWRPRWRIWTCKIWVLNREVIGTGLQFQSLALFCGTWTVEARVETETWEGGCRNSSGRNDGWTKAAAEVLRRDQILITDWIRTNKITSELNVVDRGNKGIKNDFWVLALEIR